MCPTAVAALLRARWRHSVRALPELLLQPVEEAAAVAVAADGAVVVAGEEVAAASATSKRVATRKEASVHEVPVKTANKLSELLLGMTEFKSLRNRPRRRLSACPSIVYNNGEYPGGGDLKKVFFVLLRLSS